MAFTRINEITPNGGEYSEIHFLDSDNNEVEENSRQIVLFVNARAMALLSEKHGLGCDSTT